jgi:hypothetical protein
VHTAIVWTCRQKGGLTSHIYPRKLTRSFWIRLLRNYRQLTHRMGPQSARFFRNLNCLESSLLGPYAHSVRNAGVFESRSQSLSFGFDVWAPTLVQESCFTSQIYLTSFNSKTLLIPEQSGVFCDSSALALIFNFIHVKWQLIVNMLRRVLNR